MSTLWAGDFDSDGDVDGNDFLLWQQGYGLLEGASPSDGDANADDAVDAQDLVAWQNDYGGVVSAALDAGSTSVGVPEPTSSSLALLAFAGALLGRGSRRKRQITFSKDL